MSVSLPHRPNEGHKGTFGRVLVVAGSPGMSGAACLAATAALRSGSGLVTVAVPESIQSIVAGYEPSYMTTALPCDDKGQLATPSESVIDQLVAGRDAVAIGPGLGTSSAVSNLVAQLMQHTTCPLVIDADALNCVAAGKFTLDRSTPTILTPHPGEFARLTGRSIGDVQSNRISAAHEYAVGNNVIVVLKGPKTIVTDGNTIYENTTGNSGMATGGTGDVLTGIIASLCGQSMDSIDAAVTAVYAHGLSGDLCANADSPQGMIASDLLLWLPKAWAKMSRRTFAN